MKPPWTAVALVLATFACGPTSPLGGTHAQLSVAPATVDFGAQPLGTSVTRQLTLNNAGERTIRGLWLSSPRPTAAFSFGQAPAQLGGGETVSVTVTWTPSVEGPDGTTLTIASDADNAEVLVSIAGRAVAAAADDAGLRDDAGVTDAGPPDGGADAGRALFPWDGGNTRCGDAGTVLDVTFEPSTGTDWGSLHWNGQALAALAYTRVPSGQTAGGLTMLSLTGQVLSPLSVVTPAGPTTAPQDLEWTGSSWGMLFQHGVTGSASLFFSDATSAGLDGGLPLAPAARPYMDHGSLAWNPIDHQFAAVWDERSGPSTTDFTVGFARLDASGAQVGSSLNLGPATGTALMQSSEALAWVGDGYLVGYALPTGLTVGRITRQGGLVAQHSVAANGYQAALAWSGTHAGVAWKASSGAVSFTRVDSTGAPVDGHQLTLGSAFGGPSLAWTGAGWLLAWADAANSSGVAAPVWVASIDSAGNLVRVRQLTCASKPAYAPSLVAVGNLAAALIYEGGPPGTSTGFEGHLVVFPAE